MNDQLDNVVAWRLPHDDTVAKKSFTMNKDEFWIKAVRKKKVFFVCKY